MEVGGNKEEAQTAKTEEEKAKAAATEEEKKPEPAFEILHNPARVTIRQSGQCPTHNQLPYNTTAKRGFSVDITPDSRYGYFNFKFYINRVFDVWRGLALWAGQE